LLENVEAQQAKPGNEIGVCLANDNAQRDDAEYNQPIDGSDTQSPGARKSIVQHAVDKDP
jgi:hypothetical protein